MGVLETCENPMCPYVNISTEGTISTESHVPTEGDIRVCTALVVHTDIRMCLWWPNDNECTWCFKSITMDGLRGTYVGQCCASLERELSWTVAHLGSLYRYDSMSIRERLWYIVTCKFGKRGVLDSGGLWQPPQIWFRCG